MKRFWIVFYLFMAVVCSVGVQAAWDETLYREVVHSIRVPEFPQTVYDVTAYGASPSASAADNQKAINKAIVECSSCGGGLVMVKGGVFTTGAIRLERGVKLVVEEDAVLKFAYIPELYPVVKTRWEGIDCHNISPCIYACGVTDVAVSGKGTIDGSGENDTWWHWCGAAKYGWKEGMPSQRDSRPRLLQMAEDNVPADKRVFTAADRLRPQLVQFYGCDGVLVEDVTLLRFPFWVLHPVLSKNVTVRGVKFINDGPNGDGCDPESCDGVLIENCFFNTGDDCIAVKSGRNNDGSLWKRPCENIIIRNCEMKNGHGGVVVGSEISGGCRNLFAEDCRMDSPDLDRVVRIKTNTCRGGVVENINVRNIKVGRCREAVVKINLDYENREKCSRAFPPVVRNINVENVVCDESRYGVLVIGLPSRTNVYGVDIADCRFNNVKDGNKITGKTRDINLKNVYVNGSMCLPEKPFYRFSEWMTWSEMSRNPQSFMLDFSKKPKWSYVMGIELEAMLDTYLAYRADSILNYCRSYTDRMIDAEGKIVGYKLADYNLDNVRTGHFVNRLHDVIPEKKNLRAIGEMMRQLDRQPRTREGVYWHKAIYAYQVWLDGIFMGLPLRIAAAPKFYKGKKLERIYDDAVDQLVKTYERTFDNATGLNRHAWDENRDMFWSDDLTGLSRHCWGRAQGWYAMALVEVLDALPDGYARRGEVMALLDKVLDAVVKWQDVETGVWYQVLDSPDRDGNYLESTCSSMFAYSMLKGVRKGYADSRFLDHGIRAYKGIVKQFLRVDSDRNLSLTRCCSVAGLGPGTSEAVRKAAPKITEDNKRRDGSFEYYISEPVRDNDAKGVGPFIWASLEMERLGFGTELLD